MKTCTWPVAILQSPRILCADLEMNRSGQSGTTVAFYLIEFERNPVRFRGGSRIKSDCSSTTYKWAWPIKFGAVRSLECNTHANIQSAMNFIPLLN